MPKTVFEITGTVTLNDCDNVISSARASAAGPAVNKDNPINVSESVMITPLEEADYTQQYYIPLDNLRTWTKQANLVLNLNSNKTLQSISGTINDQSGPIVAAAVVTAVEIGGAVLVPLTAPVAVGAAFAGAHTVAREQSL